MPHLSRLWRRLSDGIYTLAAWSFLGIVAATGYEVAARYLFRQPTIWAAELSVMIASGAFLISGAYVMRADQHLSITILYEVVPRWLKRVFDVLRYLVILWFCLAIVYFCFQSGWEPLVRWERAGTAWNPPMPAVIKPLIVLVAAVMAVQATINLARRLRGEPIEGTAPPS